MVRKALSLRQRGGTGMALGDGYRRRGWVAGKTGRTLAKHALANLGQECRVAMALVANLVVSLCPGYPAHKPDWPSLAHPNSPASFGPLATASWLSSISAFLGFALLFLWCLSSGLWSGSGRLVLLLVLERLRA